MIRGKSASFSLFLLIAVILMRAPAFGGATLTCGGAVGAAADTTSADGGTWVAYDVADSAAIANGTVGEFASGFWAGEVGASLIDFAVGDELIAFIEKVVDGSTSAHKGYYAVMDHTLGNSDPALFEACTLRAIPMPAATLSGGDVTLTWSHALEDSTTENIIGYNVFSSMNGTSFTKINETTVAVNTYNDFQALIGTRYYAIGLVYRGNPEVNGQVISQHVEIDVPLIGDIDGDGDVDGADLFSLADNFNTIGCGGCPEDLSGDDNVNNEDVNFFSQVFGAIP
jgi:hypothetical protein